jgi:thiol-disulfide isomerase/thioredoxin
VIELEFWAAWRTPCFAEIPVVNSLAESVARESDPPAHLLKILRFLATAPASMSGKARKITAVASAPNFSHNK